MATRYRSLFRTAVRIGAVVVGAVVVPVVDGVATSTYKLARMDYPAVPIVEGLPTVRARHPEKPVVAIIASNRATEVTDFLPPYQMLAASGSFNVYVVTPERAPATMHSGMMRPAGLSIVPDYSFGEYDLAVARTPDLIVIPYLPGFTPEGDASTLAWIRKHVGPETRLLSVCAGVEILAATGLLDGHRATGNLGGVSRYRKTYPRVQWQEGLRYVEDGRLTTSARLNAGIDATLAVIDRMAGREAALRAVRETRYAHTNFLDEPHHDDPGIDVRSAAAAVLLNPRSSAVGVKLDAGVDEVALAAILEFTGASFSRTSAFVDGDAPVRSRFGLTLLPVVTYADAARLDRVTVPREGEFGYDVVTRDLARRDGELHAVTAARNLNYIPDHLDFQPSAWNWGWWRLLTDALIGAVVVWSLVVYRKRRRASTRRLTPNVSAAVPVRMRLRS
jgi:putative intracellular protease/amidase